MVQNFKRQIEPHTNALQELIERLPDKGDTEEESQKLCLINRLNDFYYACNGLKEEDFEE